ncbi:MAG: hypothetical protein ABI588_09770 [Arenimonas sp.]
MKLSRLLMLSLCCCTPAFAQSKPPSKPYALPAMSTKPPVESGPVRVRVSIVGFVAVAQTWDDAMQRDGKDDEVFLLAEARRFQVADNVASAAGVDIVRSLVMGDINGFRPEDRIRAGHASDDGGIQTGDKVGTTGTRHGTPRADRLPLRIFEGELYGGMSLLVVPTIWEWDGAPGPLEQLARGMLAPLDVAGASFDIAAAEIGRSERGADTGLGYLGRYSELLGVRDVVGVNEVQDQTVVGTQADRPIGMSQAGGGKYRFDPWVIRLGPQGVRNAAARDRGLGPGVIVLHYEDAPALRGKYDLYVQIEDLTN